mmetsp:Transcript_67566/g.162218  ORF Transcript_67566/g.162218 Transcript_67566/m.162218 type:complete len:225 (-) Transcript_67566:1626-2300(-)
MISLYDWVAMWVYRTADRITLPQSGSDVRQAIVAELEEVFLTFNLCWLLVLNEPLHIVGEALLLQVCEEARLHLGDGRSLWCSLQDLRFVHGPPGKATLERSLVDHHGILHVIACVGNDSNNGVGARGVSIESRAFVHIRTHQWLLRRHYSPCLVVGTIRIVVEGRSHGLLQHLALIHVPWTLVVVAEWGEASQMRQHICGCELLVRIHHWQLLWNLILWNANL